MKIGKVPMPVLKKIMTGNKKRRSDIMVRPAVGEDCAAVDVSGEWVVLSCDPITGASENMGYIAVNVLCNDIASCGGEPIGVLLTLLLPENTEEETLLNVMRDAERAAEELNIEILGGHTEVTDAVNKIIISGAVVGKTLGKKFIYSSTAEISQDVVMTKWAGLEGTAILAADCKEELLSICDENAILNGLHFISYLSVVKESKIAVRHGVTAMHDATEGGVLGACYEIAEASGVGIEIFADKIPLKEETKLFCDFYHLDPFRLISSGTLIMACFNGRQLVNRLIENGINASIIGKIIPEGKYLIQNGRKTVLAEPDSDELFQRNHDRIV